jgi:N-methylhydantoinase B
VRAEPARGLLAELGRVCSGLVDAVEPRVPSAVLRERIMDAGAAIADSEGRVLACSELRHLGTFASAARTAAAGLEFPFDPGDVALLSDPFSGGSRVVDFHVLSRIEVGDAAGPWIALCRATAADLGGDCFGGLNPDASEIWAEGARITPLAIFDARGGMATDVLECVVLNSRTPRLLRAELEALVAAVRLAAEPVAKALAGSRVDISSASEPLRDLVAEEARSLLSDVSGGSDARAVAGGAIVRVEASVADDEIRLDLCGSDRAGAGYANARRGTTISAALEGALPAGARMASWNAGLLDAVAVLTEPGTLVDAPYPVATGAAVHSVAAAVRLAVRAALHGPVETAEPDDRLGRDGRLAQSLADRLAADERAAA